MVGEPSGGPCSSRSKGGPVQARPTKGIFCLEGDWDPDLRIRTTVEPMLQLLEHSMTPRVPFIRRDVGTLPEFEHYLCKWTLKKYARFPILYLAFHGDAEVLYVGERNEDPVDFDWLEARLKGRCRGRVIHMGSCGTMDVHGNRLRGFLDRTGALAICGYTCTVEWMLSAAFEIILLSQLQSNTFTRRGMLAVRRRVLDLAPKLSKKLQFRMQVAEAAKKSAAKKRVLAPV